MAQQHTLDTRNSLTALTFFFFNDTATTEIYTLSLHDALPISSGSGEGTTRRWPRFASDRAPSRARVRAPRDRKSTRLNSSHVAISYAVFCLKKKKKQSAYSIYTKKKKTNIR